MNRATNGVAQLTLTTPAQCLRSRRRGACPVQKGTFTATQNQRYLAQDGMSPEEALLSSSIFTPFDWSSEVSK